MTYTYIEYDGRDTIYQYSSRHVVQAQEKEAFSEMGHIVQLVAYETGFVALSHDGRVWTWGDERYSACLGRQVTHSRYGIAPFSSTEHNSQAIVRLSDQVS